MININYDRDSLFDELGLKRLKESYMLDHEKSPQERYAFVAEAFGSNPEHAQRLYDYASKHWLSFATPILSFGRTKNGLPISCYLSYLEDTSEGLVNTLSEVNWLSMLGGGVGLHIGIRSAGEKSVGVMPHLKVYEASSLAYKQGKTRRGSYAAYLDISHPDIVPFLEMRKPTGDANMRVLNLNHGINISDKFMQLIEACTLNPNIDDTWELIEPNTGKVASTISAKYLWEQILEVRMQTGEPYLHFIDTANAALPDFQKNLGLSIKGSNLCQEIELVTDKERTAVCCLSSVNLEYYSDWKNDNLFLGDILEMLDNVIEYFITHAPDSISRARYSAWRERSVGVGALGFHAYLQKHNIPFASALAKSANLNIFKHIRKGLDEKNYSLAIERGACTDAAKSNVMQRCAHVMAVAPNASTSIILGNTSPSIEPYAANSYRQDTLSGSYTTKNKFLDSLVLKEAQKHTEDENWYDDTWSSITAHQGSVQHLDWLTDYDKAVFKTAREIPQAWVVEHAADRQQFIDQGQSVNLFFHPTVSRRHLHQVHMLAWKRKLKGLYYCRSSKLNTAEKVGERIERVRIEEEINFNSCIACEG